MPLTKATYSMIEGAEVNVLDYGADPTGAVDSTTEIQAAITAATGKTVRFPAGTYKTNATLNLVDGCKLVGDGYNSTTIYLSVQSQIGIIPANNNEISHLKFTGTGSLDSTYYGRCVIEGDPSALGLTGKKVHIHDCYFDSTISTCAIGGNNLVDWIIEHNIVDFADKSEHGIYLSAGSTRCRVANNYLNKSAKTAISQTQAINIKGSASCWFIGNFITGVGWDGYGIVSSTVASNDLQILNNRFYDLDTAGCIAIRVGSAAQDTNVIISGNQIYEGYIGILCEASNSLIQGNRIESSTTHGISVDGTNFNTSGTVVQGNAITACTGSGVVVFEADDYVNVLGNAINGCGAGITWFSGSSVGGVYGNVCENNTADYTFTTAVPNDVNQKFDTDGSVIYGAATKTAANATYSFFVDKTDNNVPVSIAGVGTDVSRFYFKNTNGVVGSIRTSGSTTSYVTSSDYRLKDNVQPMTEALSKLEQLKPVTFNWKCDGSAGQGFIAHELQTVVPDAVSGKKDEVDVNGEPVYQGVDTSFIVATLVAAIKELKQDIDAYKASHP